MAHAVQWPEALAVQNVYAAEERGWVPMKTLLLAAPFLLMFGYIAGRDGLLTALISAAFAIAAGIVAALLWVEFWKP